MLEQDHGQNVSRSGNETARAQNVQANKTNRLGICKSGIEQAAMLFIHTHRVFSVWTGAICARRKVNFRTIRSSGEITKLPAFRFRSNVYRKPAHEAVNCLSILLVHYHRM